MRIPLRTRWFGPSTSRSAVRAGAIYAGTSAAGLIAVLRRRSPQAQAVGLGMVAPGGGFLATGQPVRALLSAVGVLASGLAWFVTGNAALAPAVWASTALASGRKARHRGVRPIAGAAVPAGVAVAVAAGLSAQVRHHRRLTGLAEQRNRYLEVAPRPILLADADVATGPELSECEVGLMRTLLDLALQPVDSWEGYTHLDQFREAGFRYQLTGSQWAFALQQFCRTPALSGYLTEAQRRMIVKHQVRKVWSYWFFENLWGNLEVNADPIRRQNVMLSGFLGTTLGLYETTTQDVQFSRPGALEFAWSSKRFWRYGFDELARAIRHNLLHADRGWNLSSCEPNWLFAFCNTVSMNTLIMHDRLHGTSYAQDCEEKFANAIDREFTSPDGRLKLVRSTRLGLAIGAPALVSDVQMSTMIRPYAPELADRLWTIMREEFLDPKAPRLIRKQSAFDTVDPGNYTRNAVGLYAAILSGANEVGDREVSDRALEELLEIHPPQWDRGRVTFKGVSVFHHTCLARALMGRRGSYLDAVRRGMPERWTNGPRIASAPYPDIVVTRAVSDGRNLEAVLVPGATKGRITLKVDRLAPGRTYQVDGGVERALTADAVGVGMVDVDVDARSEIRLHM